MPRPSHLLTIGADAIDQLVQRPEQTLACSRIATLIDGLRRATSDQGYFDIQVQLFDWVAPAQVALMEARRNRHREQQGKRVSPPLLASWADDERLWYRIQRQYRAVGDALAWKRLNFNRRFILAYSRNADPGPLAARPEGVAAEVKEVARLWRDHRELALIHDLTSCLRIGDVTVFETRGPRVREIKSSGRKPRPQQLRRMNDALEFLAGRGPLRDPVEGTMWEFVTDVQFKTRFRELGRALELAEQQRASSIVVRKGWVLDCAVGARRQPEPRPDSVSEGLERFHQLKTRAYSRAGFDASGTHLLRIGATDDLAVSPALAPPTIFPLEPWMCAMLTCDLAAYLSVMSWGLIAESFRGQGFTVTMPLAMANDRMTGKDPVLVARRRGAKLTITAQIFSQVALELVEPGRYAAAMREAVDEGLRRGARGQGVLSFANERAVWR